MTLKERESHDCLSCVLAVYARLCAVCCMSTKGACSMQTHLCDGFRKFSTFYTMNHILFSPQPLVPFLSIPDSSSMVPFLLALSIKTRNHYQHCRHFWNSKIGNENASDIQSTSTECTRRHESKGTRHWCCSNLLLPFIALLHWAHTYSRSISTWRRIKQNLLILFGVSFSHGIM